MKVLVVGSGGREHALAWKSALSPQVSNVYVAPGNAGTAAEPGVENVDIGVDDFEALADFAAKKDIALTIVGPEALHAAWVVSARVRRQPGWKDRKPLPRNSCSGTASRRPHRKPSATCRPPGPT